MTSDTASVTGSTVEASVSSGAAAVGAANGSTSSNGQGNAPTHAKSYNGGPNSGANFPPPKTDKPRPHGCGTCGRSFARLEHLKRHERSHTKEKPFECPDCARCFARRDLLLRHQQKLHMTAMPTSRQRGGRRESTSSTATTGTNRVRKSSVANASGAPGGSGTSSMRPRANTIAHVDNATLGMLAAANASVSRNGGMGFGSGGLDMHHGLPGVGGYTFRGMSTAIGNHGDPHVLPKLETHSLSIDVGASLRTAPPYAGAGGDVDMQSLWYGPASSTVNPAQLHFSDSPHSLAFDTPESPYHQGFPPTSQGPPTLEDDGTFAWLHGFENQMSFNSASNEHAIDISSPSAVSNGSHDGLNEIMLDGSNHTLNTSSIWQAPMAAPMPMPPDYSVDMSASVLPELFPPGQISPKSMHGQVNPGEQYFSSPPMISQTPISFLQGGSNPFVHPPMMMEPETPSNSAASISSSQRQSSVTSVSTDSITDATRQALINSLAQSSLYGQHAMKSSQPSMNSPLSADYVSRSQPTSGMPLPSTYDLQRYVAAYIQYFHPHLPFLHIPSLSFDSPVFTSSLRAPGANLAYGQSGIAGGAGSLILAMAAIGAFYEYETAASKDLFEMAKKMIHIYLEERRKADMSAALSGASNVGETAAQNTPLWLVQAMLLNVIYGHNCGDKTSAGIASTHCAALVSLARAAELALPSQHSPWARNGSTQHGTADRDIDMINGVTAYNTQQMSDVQNDWNEWKLAEERKRTLYAVFILSSLLVSAYNHAPALMNSEIKLELPCDEDLWSADSAEAWRFACEARMGEPKPLSFASALSTLLTASQRETQQRRMSQSFDQAFGSGVKVENLPESDIRPSTFGCLVLINALHNYIWETRQRHIGRQWTPQETEAMHAHIEPALRAWQAAWASNPLHSYARPNPSGMGSLSADCIPLLDLAYVRLFVNLGRSKEAFFRRDFDGVADELAQGTEIIQHAGYSPDSAQSNTESASGAYRCAGGSPVTDGPYIKTEQHSPNEPLKQEPQSSEVSSQTSKRERHLRKAAFYATNSLAMSDKLGVTFADFDSRELPISSALCAYDCAQVIAEWVATVQQRVGRYLGILGQDAVNFAEVPAMMLLDDEDSKLFKKVHEVIHHAEIKLANNGTAANGAISTEGGYGSKILMVMAQMLQRAAVWPVTVEAAQSLQTQALHVQERAEQSINPCV